jgi:hypothetical protein
MLVRSRPNWDDDDPKPRGPRRRAPTMAEEFRQRELALLSHFQWFLHYYGIETARQVFSNYTREPTKEEQKNLTKFGVICELAAMTPKPNIRKKARELAINQGIAEDDRRFEKRVKAIDKKIRKWWKHRDEIKAKFASTLPPLGEPASFVVTQRKKWTF